MEPFQDNPVSDSRRDKTTAQTHADRSFSPATFNESDDESQPKEIGRYQILGVLGEGGMGIVYHAEQSQPVRRIVAIKLLKLGMDTRRFVARFNVERQSLAMMSHPNVAHVYDAGVTETGRPYFVMEYVPGQTITAFCNRHTLDIRQRLELFIQACDAVQHAHQKGIIHRDIKPGNVLVVQSNPSEPALVKVIDFGVAKTLEESPISAMATEAAQLIGTPEYMSPEQAAMVPGSVDTRSDVYSLGVLLYELLTGDLPFDPKKLRVAGPIDAARIMREVEPSKPSTKILKGFEKIDRGQRARRLRGDLDSIVMKAIEKDRARRYPSASEFRADVSRYLRGDPVLAGPTGAAYRLRKWARRYRVALISASAIVMSLIVGLTIASLELVRARRAEHAEIAAHADVVQRLWDSYLSQAHFGRTTSRPGQRLKGLAICGEAARIRPSIEVRNEAIACMAMDDIEVIKLLEFPGRDDQPIMFDPSMQRYAESNRDGVISLRRSIDGSELFSLPAIGSRPGRSFDFSPNGQFLVIGYRGGAVRFCVWNLNTRKPVFTLEKENESHLSVEFLPDSSAIAIGRLGGFLDLYNLRDGRLSKTLQIGCDVGRITFSPDGTKVIVCCDPTDLKIFSTATGALLSTFKTPAQMDTLAWSPNGKMIAYCGDENTMPIHVIDAETGNEISQLRGHISKPVNLIFVHNGDRLVSAGWDNTLRVWNPFTGEQILSVDNSGDWITKGSDQETISVSNAQQTKVSRSIMSREFRTVPGEKSDQQYSSTDISADGKLIVAARTGGLRFWNALTGECVGTLPVTHPRTVVFTPDGQHVLLSVPGGVREERIPSPSSANGSLADALEQIDTTGGMALSSDGRTIVYDTGDGTIMQTRLGDLARALFVGKGRYAARFLAVSPDGAWAASSIRHELGFHVWNLRSVAPPLDLPSGSSTHEMGAVVFSPNGKQLITEDTNGFSIWEVETWKLVHRISRAMARSVGSLCFAPDGKVLAAVSDGSDVKLFDTTSWNEVATLAAPSARMHISLTFSKDGRQLIATTLDPYLSVWDIGRLRAGLRPMGLDW